jgi:XTP/dITP diphosphohydrolase
MSKKNILIATANRGKAEEVRKIFADTDYEVKFLFDFPEEVADFDVFENAKSFEGNALIKAIIFGERLSMITLADDSGLCVDVLDGQPGVYSARYAKKGDDKANYEKLLGELEGVPIEKRSAHYHCSVALYNPLDKFVETVEARWEGRIALEPRGDKSFGYAPIFLPTEFNYERSSAEFNHEDLIVINHRGQAFRRALDVLKGLV